MPILEYSYPDLPTRRSYDNVLFTADSPDMSSGSESAYPFPSSPNAQHFKKCSFVNVEPPSNGVYERCKAIIVRRDISVPLTTVVVDGVEVVSLKEFYDYIYAIYDFKTGTWNRFAQPVTNITRTGQ